MHRLFISKKEAAKYGRERTENVKIGFSMMKRTFLLISFFDNITVEVKS